MSSSTASSSTTTNIENSKTMGRVFISFTLDDVEVVPFVSILHKDLTWSGIPTCFDNIRAIRRANRNSLRRAIKGSRVSVVVFSEHYGGSRECLEELEKIMDYHRATGHVVFPVFFGVDLWDVRMQKGRFGEEFERMLKKTSVEEDTVLTWRRTLFEVASFHRYLSSHDRYCITFVDCDAVDEIADFVRMVLDGKYLSCPFHGVGIDVLAKDVIGRFGDYLHKVNFVGIWGKEGIGKTSLAKVIYNRMFQSFEGSSFLANIKDVWKQDNGEYYLRKQLLSDINSTTDMASTVHNTEMEKILAHKRVLVVLDDVSNTDQLISLCGSHGSLGVGSIIMITAREKKVLDLFELEVVYEMKEMDTSKSLDLFRWHAFKTYNPTYDFIKLSRKAISYCGGLPLALEVLGSLLIDRTTSEWRSILKLLKRNRSNVVLNILKLSYDFLDDNEKKIFIEIACFYMGMDRHNITQLLNGCGLAAETGISTLIQRGLLKVDKYNKFDMHDLVQEMGKELNHLKPKSKWIHNVFLSFRGLDTRRSFTSHLYAALRNAGIEVYMDEKLKKGENISSSLLQAIEDSRVSIIIFSIHYANSIWCLQELEKIMECHRAIGQEVLPVFYDVEPSEVRNQIGSVGKALEGLVQRSSASKDMIIRWKKALTEAANLSGWNRNNYRTEIEMIGDILKTVTTRLDDSAYLLVADHPVGVESRVQDMIQLLSGKSNEVRIVGILGMGGSGKTTIAKAIYNEINQNFEGKSFLSNIREAWDQDDGRVSLQEQLLSGILRTRRMKLHSIELGKTIIKERLCHKRALVVLDDINDLDQLSALCGSREWFGQGSRIIITTRDERLLKASQVVYRTQEMDECESLELFSWHAFKQASPKEDFIELSRRVVAYSGRLPLALEVLGSYLFERKIAEWESTLSKLELIPNDQIQKKLKLSYDGLSDHMEKEIFLDICCFFIGKDKNYVTQILDGCGLAAEIGITVLIERSLVKVDKNNKLEMHDLLKVMGREIIREMSPEQPEDRSRLWFHDDVVDVMTRNTATKAIKGLAFSLPKNKEDVFETKAFKEMKRLRLLQLGHVKLTGDFDYLSKDLCWLCWHGFPLRYMPRNFCLKKSVAIDLKHSNLQLVWKEPQFLYRLKFLNLSHSHYLTKTPDFSRLPNLEKIILKDCPKLLIVHSTIGDLKHLILLNLKDCKSLSQLPKSIYKLKSLKSLDLSGCSKIDKLEEDIMQMESLTILVADDTAITEVPRSLVRLKNLKHVCLGGYKGLSSHVFPSLIFNLMSPRNLMYKVFGSISPSIQSLSLGLSAMNRAHLDLRPSTSQITYNETHTSIDFQNSINTASSGNFTSSLVIRAGECSKAIHTLTNSISQGWTNDGSGDCDCSFPGNTKCRTFKDESSSVWFKVPNTGCTLKAVTLRIIYSSSLDNLASECDLLSVSMINYTKGTIQLYKRDTVTAVEDEEWQGLMSNLEPGDEVEFAIFFGHRFAVKSTIVHLIYGDSANDMEVSSESEKGQI